MPEQFPLPPDVVATSSLSTEPDRVHVRFEVSSTGEELVGFLEDGLHAGGWELLNRRRGGDTTRFRIAGHGWTGAVTVFGGSDPAAFLVQLGPAETETAG